MTNATANLNQPTDIPHVIWTVVPAGTDGQKLMLSIDVAPQLPPTCTIAGESSDEACRLFANWPEEVSKLDFDLTVKISDQSTQTTRYYVAQMLSFHKSVLSPSAWSQIFSPNRSDNSLQVAGNETKPSSVPFRQIWVKTQGSDNPSEIRPVPHSGIGVTHKSLTNYLVNAETKIEQFSLMERSINDEEGQAALLQDQAKSLLTKAAKLAGFHSRLREAPPTGKPQRYPLPPQRNNVHALVQGSSNLLEPDFSEELNAQPLQNLKSLLRQKVTETKPREDRPSIFRLYRPPDAGLGGHGDICLELVLSPTKETGVKSLWYKAAKQWKPGPTLAATKGRWDSEHPAMGNWIWAEGPPNQPLSDMKMKETDFYLDRRGRGTVYQFVNNAFQVVEIYDFLERLSLLRNYPLLRRTLGLVLDLDINLDQRVWVETDQNGVKKGTAQSLRVLLEQKQSLRIGISATSRPHLNGVASASPFTIADFGAAPSDFIFRAADQDSGSWIRKGMVDLFSKDSTGDQKFRLEYIDLEDWGSKVVAQAEGRRGAIAWITNENNEVVLATEEVKNLLGDLPTHGSGGINVCTLFDPQKGECPTAELLSALQVDKLELHGLEHTLVPIDKNKMPIRVRLTVRRWVKQLQYILWLVEAIQESNGTSITWKEQNHYDPFIPEKDPVTAVSKGISLVCQGRADDVEENRERTSKRKRDLAYNLKNRSKIDIELYSNDLVMGYIPEVQTALPSEKSNGKSTGWVSLCEHYEDYSHITDVMDILKEYLREAPDKVVITNNGPRIRSDGMIRLGSSRKRLSDGAGGQDKIIDLISEEWFTWTGWNLCLPDPRGRDPRAVDPTQHREIPISNEAIPHSQVPLRFWDPVSDSDGISRDSYFVGPHSLRGENPYDSESREYPPPKSGEYYFRVRVVDIAGNSLSSAQAHGPAIVGRFMRNEPLALPTVLLDSKPDDSTKLMQLVVKNGVGSDARWLAPPRVHHDLVRFHGRLNRPLHKVGGCEAIGLDQDGNIPTVVRRVPADRKKTECSEYMPIYVPFVSGALAAGHLKGKENIHYYYPDPLVNSIHYELSAYDESVVKGRIPLYHSRDWPHARAIKIVLKPWNYVGEVKSLDQLITMDTKHARLTALVPPGWEIKLKLCSRAEKVNDVPMIAGLYPVQRAFERRNIVAQALKQTKIDLQEFVAGFGDRLETHPLVCGDQEVTLVHAVSRPVDTPILEAVGFAQQRQAGDSMAQLRIVGKAHLMSTGQLDITSKWVEQIDDPASGMIPYPKWMYPYVGSVDLRKPVKNDVIQAFQEKIIHQFGDSKHRRIWYSVVGTSRFGDYFVTNHGKSKESTDHLQQSAPSEWFGPLDIPSTQRPFAPEIESVVPIFKWEKGEASHPHQKNGCYTSIRRGAAFRVYLKRPWYSSGEGELLGIVVQHTPPDNNVESDSCNSCPTSSQHDRRNPPQAEEPPLALKRVLSSWGDDPIWEKGTTSFPSEFPLCDQFLEYSCVGKRLILPKSQTTQPTENIETKWNVDVVAYEPQYDEKRQLWYCEIVLKEPLSYKCFIRLSLVRYQPFALQGLELSEARTVRFMQIWPTRTLAVMQDPKKKEILRIELRGQANPTQLPHGKPKTPANAYKVEIWKPCGGYNAWVFEELVKADPEARSSQHEVELQGKASELLWSGTWSIAKRDGPRSLVVREFEQFISAKAGSAELQQTVAYLDILGLGGSPS